MSNGGKMFWNVLAGFLLFGTSAWAAWDDYRYPGEILFQTSAGLGCLTTTVVIWALLAHIFAIFPKRILFPVVILLVLRMSFGFPFNQWMSNNTASLIMTAGLAAVSGGYFLCALFKLIALKDREWFRWQHTVSVLFGGILISVLSIPLGVGGMLAGSRKVLGDYTQISLSSISMLERVFAKDGTKVFLIGMMHIGEGDFYSQLNNRMKEEVDGKRVVLTEGVSDRHEVLPKSFASGDTYARLAERFGLKVQNAEHRDLSPEEQDQKRQAWAERGIKVVNADIDVSELSPEHQGTLVLMLEALGSGKLTDLIVGPRGIEGPEMENLMMEGLIGFRNDRLMEVFSEVTEDRVDEIFIPWGAAHLPDIEKRLIDLGYEKINEESRPVVRFWNR